MRTVLKISHFFKLQSTLLYCNVYSNVLLGKYCLKFFPKIKHLYSLIKTVFRRDSLLLCFIIIDSCQIKRKDPSQTGKHIQHGSTLKDPQPPKINPLTISQGFFFGGGGIVDRGTISVKRH
jgi:hypothetical protein